ncbi:hypothetical protein R0G64_32220, partial [Pseudomonas otitidis]
PGCLLGMTLCIDELAADEVALSFPGEGGSTDEGPVRQPGGAQLEIGQQRLAIQAEAPQAGLAQADADRQR